MGEMRNLCKILVGKRDRNEQRRWKNNIKVDLMEIEWEGLDWIHLA
jgi:hypothetical protein